MQYLSVSFKRIRTGNLDNRVLEIVFYLLDIMSDSRGVIGDMEAVSADLRKLGYVDDEISRAYRMITRGIDSDNDMLFTQFPKFTSSIRILTNEERHWFSKEAYGFLLRLAQVGVIDTEQFEMILDQVMISGHPVVDLERLKQITTGVVIGNDADIDVLPDNPDAELSDRFH